MGCLGPQDAELEPQDAPKMSPRRPKTPPRRPKTPPRRPKMAKDGPRRAQEASKMPQDASKMAQVADVVRFSDPKWSPTYPKTSTLRSRGSQNGAPESSGLPKWSLEELQKPKNESSASKQHQTYKIILESETSSNLHKFINIATVRIKLCGPLLPMFASTLLRPQALSPRS